MRKYDTGPQGKPRITKKREREQGIGPFSGEG
jgi:hypothetical protein